MRVLHFYRTYFPETQGGLEEVIRQICLNARQSGVESRVVTLCDKPSKTPIKREEATVYQSKRHFEIASCSVGFKAPAEFKKHVEWADVVHYHYPWPFADLCHFLTLVKKPTVLTYHSDIVRQRGLLTLYKPLMGRFLKSVDRIVCTSPNYFATSPVLEQYSKKVDVVPIGLQEDSYPSVSDQTIDEVKQRYGEGFFLFVGVLRYYKGLHILLDAVKGADYKVMIVGSGPTESELRQQIVRDNLNNVELAGHVSDEVKVALFKLARCVVFPSYLRTEAFGVTLLEGAMYGKPLISTEVGSGTSHVNIHNETGLVVPPSCAQSLRDAMDYLYNHASIAKRMGDNARQRYEKLFQGEHMGKQYVDIYRRLTLENSNVSQDLEVAK